MTNKTSRARRRLRRNPAILRVFTAFAVLAGMMTLFSSPSGATTLSDTFELDGNPQASSDPGDDWQTLMTGAGASIARTSVPIFDGADSPTDTSYWKGGGSKDVNDIDRWAYSGTDVAPDKDEIVNAAAAAYRVADGPDADSDQDLVIAFHSDRFSNDGDAAAGFWFFKNPVELTDGKFTAPGGGALTHAIGDVLVISDFNEGEGVNTIRVFSWTAAGLTETTPAGGSAPKDCRTAGHNPYVCATENTGSVGALWSYTPKANVGTAGVYPGYTFLEGAINMSAVLPGSDQCFASFLAETRSSTSPTAQLKDFVLGDFPICRPSTTLSASPTVASPEIAVVGDQVTFSFTETNDGNVPLTNVYVDTDNSACDAAMTPASVASLAAAASQVFSCTITTGSTPAIVDIVGIGHGTDPAGRDTTYCAGAAPANTVCDADERATARAVTILPGTELSASASPTIAKQGDTVTYTILEGNDGVAPSGYSGSLALSSVSVVASSSTTGVAADCNAELGSPVSGNDAPSGTLDATETWTYQCTVTAPADDFTIQFNGSGVALAGTSHAKTVNFAYDSEERASVPVTVISPSTQLTITANAVITYTFVERNDSGDAPLTPPTATSRESMISLEATSALCNVTPVAYVSGDTGNDKILGVGESWTFSCQGSLAGPTADTGSTSSTLIGIGSGVDATNSTVTYPGDPDERDRVKVEITNYARGG